MESQRDFYIDLHEGLTHCRFSDPLVRVCRDYPNPARVGEDCFQFKIPYRKVRVMEDGKNSLSGLQRFREKIANGEIARPEVLNPIEKSEKFTFGNQRQMLGVFFRVS